MLLLFVVLAITPVAMADAPRILVMGDSISSAYGIATEDGWVTLLEQRLDAEGHPHQVTNASVSGATTASANSNLPGALERHAPQVLILQLGGNDGLRGLSLDAMERNLDAMIERAQDSGARVLLAGVRLPPNYGSAYLDRFRQVYASVAERHDIAFVPRILEGFEDRRDLMLDDEIHPNEAGQEIILENIWAGLATLLSEKSDR